MKKILIGIFLAMCVGALHGSQAYAATPENCFSTDTINGDVSITGYTLNQALGCGPDVAIPTTVGGAPIASVMGDFMGVTSIDIPHSVTRLATIRFDSLTSLTIPNSVTTISTCINGTLGYTCTDNVFQNEPLGAIGKNVLVSSPVSLC